MLCQVSSRAPGYDLARTARMAAYGGLIAGPMGSTWFNALEKNVFPRAPTSPLAIASKIGIDQAFMAPLGTALFFAITSLMDARPTAIVPAMREKLVPTVTASWKLWPLAHLVNFALIPPHQRILYTNVVSVGWTYVLSQMSQCGTQTETASASPPQQVACHVPTEELAQEPEVEVVSAGVGELVPISISH
ncbi:hypothetical protein WJX72_002169 [[Myrmecia] bisecta]|uniref:Uncharacterized protein n=1 Tax=[Myrmecia] bisecta TaxID=41462 RepID=A0AAW1Q643_9CHLO